MKKNRTHGTLPKFFSVNEVAPKLNKWPFKFLFSLCSYIAGVAWFNKQTEILRRQYSSDLSASCSEVFPYLNIGHLVSMPSGNSIKKPGGKIIVANHEGFLLDATFLCWMISQYRSDFKFIATSSISIFSTLKHYCFFLDIGLIQKRDIKKNALLYREIINWLKEGKIIIIFPETHLELRQSYNWEKRLPWSDLPHRLAKKASVPIVPIKLSAPSPVFFRVLYFSLLFFYNIKMRGMARVCYISLGIFSCKQIKYAVGKHIFCVIGDEIRQGEREMRGNVLRDHVYQLKDKNCSLNNQRVV